MSRVRVIFEVEVPNAEAYTDAQVEEWLRFSFRDNGEISGTNPLGRLREEPEPVFGTFEWEWQ